MDKLELVQEIGKEVCEECRPDRDCGINPTYCSRIINAINMIDEYIDQNKED